jgi:hypothetical protein
MPEDQNLNVEIKQPQEGNVPEPSPTELSAREAGWVPKEEFDGDEHKWVDAGEFLRRGELFQKIERQNKELKDVKKTLQLLAQHNQRVKDAAYKEAIETLKAQKKEALLEGDADAVIEIDEKIIDTKEQQKQAAIAAQQEIQQEAAQIHPEFEAWTNRNKWYSTDSPMKAFADALGNELARKNRDWAPSDVLKEVEKRVKEEFPNRFRNPNKDKPGAVEGASPKGGATKGGYQPTAFERQVAERFVRQGVFKNVSEYYKQLEESK